MMPKAELPNDNVLTGCLFEFEKVIEAYSLYGTHCPKVKSTDMILQYSVIVEDVFIVVTRFHWMSGCLKMPCLDAGFITRQALIHE